MHEHFERAEEGRMLQEENKTLYNIDVIVGSSKTSLQPMSVVRYLSFIGKLS
jgi:hypothetical protein